MNATPESAEEARGTRENEVDAATGELPNRQRRSSVPSFLFISFVLFMLTNHRGEELDARYTFLKALDSLNQQVSDYSAWLNGTASNFSLHIQNNATIPLVDKFMNFGAKLDPETRSYYTNLTGFWHGELQFHNLTSPNYENSTVIEWSNLADDFVNATNMTAVPELLGLWNWTASNKVSLSIGDKAMSVSHGQNISGDIAIIHGKVEITDPNASEELRLDFDGVHFVTNGSIYALVDPFAGRVDLRNIPSLVPPAHMNDTARAVEAEVMYRIAKLKEKIDSGSLEDIANNDDPPKGRCSFELYGQIDPAEIPQYAMEELEGEIEKPTGIWTVNPPELKLRGVLISQNCAILYEIKNTTGLKSPQLYRKITTYAGVATVVYLILLKLLLREIGRNSSAVSLSRLSRYTFLAQSLVDAISFVGHITLAILADGRPSLSVLAPAGLSCMLFIQEAQFAVQIGQIQAPEDISPTVPRPAPTPPVAPLTTSAEANATSEATSGAAENSYPPPENVPAAQPQNQAPPPINATTTTTPERPSFLRFLWHHIRTDPSARLWTIISLFLIFIFRIVIFLSLPLFFVGSLYSFIWLVQIYRSARTARSSGLSEAYTIGTTACRLFFALYFLACPKNILDVEPRRWIYGVAVFMFIQVLTIMMQERISPTFFMSNRVAAAKAYDYHPPLPLPDPEAPEQTLGDCAICMDAIEIDPSLRRRSKSTDGKERNDLLGLATGTHRPGGILNAVGAVGAASSRRTYSLAPCHHLFHTACLERWLAIKNICPQCRRPLPPL